MQEKTPEIIRFGVIHGFGVYLQGLGKEIR